MRYQKTRNDKLKLQRFIQFVQKLVDKNEKSWFFYNYEKRFEKQIRNRKAEKIIDYQNLIRHLNETRNQDIKMKVLRPRIKSEDLLIDNSAQIDEDDISQMRTIEIKRLLNIKKQPKYIQPDLSDQNNYKVIRRRNSVHQTKIEKFKKITDDFKEYRYSQPIKAPPELKKIVMRKVLLSKQKIALQVELKQLLQKEIQDFKKQINFQPRKKKIQQHDSNSNQKQKKMSPIQQQSPSKRPRKHVSQNIPAGFRRTYFNNRSRLESIVLNEDSPKQNNSEGKGQNQIKKDSEDIPLSFIINDGKVQRFHTLIPRPVQNSSGKLENDDISLDQNKDHLRLRNQKFSDIVGGGQSLIISRNRSISNADVDWNPEDESQESDVHYIQRECCQKCNRIAMKDPYSLHNHDPWKSLTHRIERFKKKQNQYSRRVILHGINTKNEMKGDIRDDDWLTTKKIKEVRRRQFFNFFADFYDKYERGIFGEELKYTFTDEEKERNLKKYFKKYYNEDLFLPTTIVDIPLNCDISAKKRLCQCFNKKKEIQKQQGSKDNQQGNIQKKTIKVKMLIGRDEYENREEYLGMSSGIQNSFISKPL